ncbi:ABC transporter permease [Nafulsella turpanensis]|uniref:ABC transporter permease n=1 Tax=Nafulsella turpanensis TaxID=1265690 RepID=UPI0003496D23|nr:ABC transporter permease [Nafulsella turpanensis]
MIVIKLVLESFRFAWNAIRSNLLRTTLSLLGVTVGIFAIIAVFTVVDSLEQSIKSSLSFLGDKTIYVQKWPWIFTENYEWWKYISRPQPTYEEYEFLHENVDEAVAVSIFANRRTTMKHASNSISGVNVFGVSFDHNQVVEIPVEKGRYFTPQEAERGANVAVIGKNIEEALFPRGNAIGKEMKVKGQRYRIIGVMEAQGESLLDGPSNDDNAFVPFRSFTKMYYSGAYDGVGATIGIKGREDDPGLEQVEAEVKGLMRQRRGLRPREEDNFALNRPQMFADFVSGIFSVVTLVGGIIGSFSILIGGFGIANIMFVSVRERTGIIGIQKSLGAKNYFILFQFLFEAVFLSLIGGLVGLGLVYLISFVPLGPLELVLTLGNVSIGMGLAIIIGIVSGIIPAWKAAKMDPVSAIRMA